VARCRYDIIDVSAKFGIHAQVVGRVEAKEGKPEVIVKSEHGEFAY
jgi:phosphoribosylformylglycinamidine cyclo-ligase